MFNWFRKKEKIDYPTADAWQYQSTPWEEPQASQTQTNHPSNPSSNPSSTNPYADSYANYQQNTMQPMNQRPEDAVWHYPTDEWEDAEKPFKWRHYAVMGWVVLMLYVLFLYIGYATSDFQSGKGKVLLPEERTARAYLKTVEETLRSLHHLDEKLESYRGKNGEWLKDYNGIVNEITQLRLNLINADMPASLSVLHQQVVPLVSKSEQPAVIFQQQDLLSHAYRMIQSYQKDFNGKDFVSYRQSGVAFMKQWEYVATNLHDLKVQYGIQESRLEYGSVVVRPNQLIMTPVQARAQEYLVRAHGLLNDMVTLDSDIEQYLGNAEAWKKEYAALPQRLIFIRNAFMELAPPKEWNDLHEQLIPVGTSDDPSVLSQGSDLLSKGYQMIQAFQRDFSSKEFPMYRTVGLDYMKTWNQVAKRVRALELAYGMKPIVAEYGKRGGE